MATMSTAMIRSRMSTFNTSRLNMSANTKKNCCHIAAFITLKCRRY